MRICFFNNIHILGGGELWVMKACRQLPSLGIDVSVICPWRSNLNRACIKEGIKVFTYHEMEGFPFYEPIYHFLKKNKVDILYCTVIGGFNEALLLESIVNKINEERVDNKLILVLKTGLPPMAGLQKSNYGFGAGPFVPRLHVVSELVKEDFLHWNPHCDPEFIEVMYEGIDLDQYTSLLAGKQKAKQNLGLQGNCKVVSCTSRLHALKGHDNLLLAIPAILEKHPNTVFMIAGEGDQKERLIKLRNHLGLEKAVKFLGHFNDIPTLLQATDVLCQPSLAEGMPNSLVEALSMEVPVIATNVGGIPEIIKHEETGLVVDPHDIKAIAESVIRLLEDDALRKSVTAKGKDIIHERFDLTKNLLHLIGRLKSDQIAASKTNVASIEHKIPILFLMNTIRTGGEETEIAILTKYLKDSQFEVSIASLYPIDEPSPVLEKLIQNKCLVDTTCHSMNDSEKLRYLIDTIRNRQIKVVVACQHTGFAYQLFHYLSDVECKLIEHGGIVEEAGMIPKNRTARYIGVSPKIKEAAAALMSDSKHAVFIPSMVDTAEYEQLDRTALRSAYGISDDECVVTFVGRLDPKKNVELLLETVRKTGSKHKHLKCLVVGGKDGYQPDYAQSLMTEFSDLSNSGQVIFTGARTDIPQLLTASDILVLPGTGEGMSHVINEAGAAGLAVLAADDGAAKLQLDNGKGGLLFPPNDKKSFQNQLEKLIDNQSLRQQIGSHLKTKVQSTYSAEAVIPQWKAILKETTNELQPQHEIYIHTKDKLLDFPREIQIQTTTFCNASCIMCPYPTVSKEFPTGRIEADLYDKILDECATEKGLFRIEPFLMNEGFTDKRMVDFISKTKQKVPHAMVTITTNGTPLIPKVTDKLVNSGLDAIWFSFNGATPETYEKIMGIPYEKTKSNIDYLLRVKPDNLQVYINMIETEPMAAEIMDNIEQWRNLGIQAGSSPLVNRAGNLENYEELNYTLSSNEPIRTCELVFYKMYILYNGDAVLCCMDWRRTVKLGNVREQSIREIWNGEKYQHIRRLHIEGRDSEIDLCSNCSYTLS